MLSSEIFPLENDWVATVLDHFDLEWVTKHFVVHFSEMVAAAHDFPFDGASGLNFMGMLLDFPEPVAPHFQIQVCQRASFIKANSIDGPGDLDFLGVAPENPIEF